MDKKSIEVSHVRHAGRSSIPAASNLPFWKQKELRKLYFLTLFLFLASTTIGYDGGLLNGLQTMETWRSFFNNPTGNRLGLFNAIPGFGGLVSIFVATYINDGLDRKKGVAIGSIILVFGSLLQCFPHPDHETRRDAMYLAGRFIMGFGANINANSSPLLITELADPQH